MFHHSWPIHGQIFDTTLPVGYQCDRISVCLSALFRRHVLGQVLKSTWWRHQMETFSALLAICARNSPVHGEFHAQRPVTRSFDVFFDMRPNKRWVSNREAGDLRRHHAHHDVIVMIIAYVSLSGPLWCQYSLLAYGNRHTLAEGINSHFVRYLLCFRIRCTNSMHFHVFCVCMLAF